MSAPTALPAWKKLSAHKERIGGSGLPGLVVDEPDRFSKFSVRADGILYDYSRQNIDSEVLADLLALAEQQNLPTWRGRLYGGDPVNGTEKRAALHMALRTQPGDRWEVGGVSVTEDVIAERMRAYAFAEAIRTGALRGSTGARFTDVVELGIGGSHLGPALACDALAAFSDHATRVHFVSNADGADLARTLAHCRPEATLFIAASKTFTTQETLLNARTARAWLESALGEGQFAKHFAAATAAPDRAEAFGIPREHVFRLWEWVGGRFSLWSAVGLPAMVALGRKHFDELLAGARDIDVHFRDAPLAENIPVLMALVGIWNRNFCGATSHAILPYAEALWLLPTYLQQLVMESLGKCVDRDNAHIDYKAAPVVWGMQGTSGQHAFYQLLHQGSDTIGVDFIGYREAIEGDPQHHPVVLANLVAQAEALLVGSQNPNAYRSCAGGRASSVLVFDRLDPRNLGRLIALYEHQVFVQSVIWNLNAFDQWGVELGKQLGKPLLTELTGGERAEHDPATAGLVDYLLK
ncbi:MAG: glucose-6-phosphate isomerase [Gammaproteobacteria bacterium]